MRQPGPLEDDVVELVEPVERLSEEAEEPESGVVVVLKGFSEA